MAVNKEGYNPTSKQKVTITSRELTIDFELAMRDEYDQFILHIINNNEPKEND